MENCAANTTTQQTTYQFNAHVLQLTDEVLEELGHVLLFPCVQGLVVHGVHLAEAAGVVGLALTLLCTQRHTSQVVSSKQPKLGLAQEL